jgi:hypothetical protein
MAKMLSKMRRGDHKSKRLFKSLDWKTKTKVRALYKSTVGVDALGVVTGNYELSKANN